MESDKLDLLIKLQVVTLIIVLIFAADWFFGILSG